MHNHLNYRIINFMKFSSKFFEAIQFAADLHADQTRKGTNIPYLSHLLIVAGYVLDFGGNEDEAIAAVLHDAIEDQGGKSTREQIRTRFGETITRIVDGCSDSDTIIKSPWRMRKENYLKHLLEADDSVLLVSAADKLHNANSILRDYRQIGESIWKRFHGGKEGTLWYYRELVKIFQQRKPGPLTDELARTVNELEKAVSGE